MTVSPQPISQSRLSKASLFSLIFGILGCIPFVSGALAVLLGIIGFVKTGRPGITGRWMAIVGTLLGLASVVIWTFVSIFSTGVVAMVLTIVGMTAAPRAAAHDFIKDLSEGNQAAAHALGPDIADADLTKIGGFIRDQGTFTDTTFSNTAVDNDKAHLEGTAQFSKGTIPVTVDLKDHGSGKWEIQEINFKP